MSRARFRGKPTPRCRGHVPSLPWVTVWLFVDRQWAVGDLDEDAAILDHHRVGREGQLRRWVERLTVHEVEAGQVERAGQGPGRLAVRTARAAAGQEALVELEVLVGADSLERANLTAGVDHDHLVRVVDEGHLHRAFGHLVDREQVDPAGHAAALSGAVTPRRCRPG